MSAEHIRLFVALELPNEVRRVLISWRDQVLASIGGLRPVAPTSLHVTLCFLGWQDASAVDQIGAACDSVAALAPPSLSLGAGVWLPPRRPRVLAVELSDEGGVLASIQARLSSELERGGWYEPESRPFLAHVTVARAQKGDRVRARGDGGAGSRSGAGSGGGGGAGSRSGVRADDLPPLPQLRFSETRITLFRSRLLRGGAQYEPLRSVVLGR